MKTGDKYIRYGVEYEVVEDRKRGCLSCDLIDRCKLPCPLDLLHIFKKVNKPKDDNES